MANTGDMQLTHPYVFDHRYSIVISSFILNHEHNTVLCLILLRFDHRYAFWFSERPQQRGRPVDYEDNIKHLGTFGDVSKLNGSSFRLVLRRCNIFIAERSALVT